MLHLLGEQNYQRLLHLNVAHEPGQLDPHLRYPAERHHEVLMIAASRRPCPQRLSVLHSSKLAPHLLDTPAEGHHLRVRVGRELTHDLELHLSRHDLALQARRGFDRPARLILERNRSVPLLESPECLLRRVQIGLRAGQLLCQEHPLPSRLSDAVARHEPIELLDVEVGHRCSHLRVCVLDADRDDALSRYLNVGIVLQRLDRVFRIVRPIPVLEPESLHHRLRHRPALEDAQDHVPVRRERGDRDARHLLEQS